MGKVFTYLTILIFIDLFFIATGQICGSSSGCSLGSIIFNSILDITNILTLSFWTELIGSIADLFNSTTGLGAIIIGATVLIGSIFIPGEIRVFIPISFSLALLAADFVFIASYLISINVLLGTMIMTPMIILYTFTIVEWLRGKD